MAEVVDVHMTPAADARPQKRSFAADITNGNQGKSQPKKPKQDPKKKVLFEWSVEDMANSKARVDATKAARAYRRPYGVTMALQQHHAPKSLLPSAAFYEHKGSDAVAAMQARRSGAAPSLADGALKKRPLFGGIADVSNAPAAPATIVGVDERLSAAGTLGTEVQARKKKARKGLASSFSVWYHEDGVQEGVDGKLVGKYECAMKKALPDIRQKHPGETITEQLLSCLLGVKKRELLRKKAGLEQQLKDSKFTAKYVD